MARILHEIEFAKPATVCDPQLSKSGADSAHSLELQTKYARPTSRLLQKSDHEYIYDRISQRLK
jgi:hypothetical protein